MRLTPDYLFDSYREITPDFLHRQGIALLLTDLDYTLAPKAVRRPNEALKSWIAELQGAGITVMIVSNNRSGTRVTEFCADLGIGYQGHFCALLLPSYTLAARLLSIESPWQFPLFPDGG